MAAETLQDPKSQQQALNGDSAPVETTAKHEIQAEKQQDAEYSDEMASSGVDNPEEKIADGKDQEEEEKNEGVAAHGDKQEQEEAENENGYVEEKKETEPATPATGSDRPTRERKSVERYTVSSPHKFPGYSGSATNTFSIDQGSGTQLKDIPNVAFKLSKRKPDDNLRALHNILFGKKAKAQTLKRNIGMFSGYVWTENEEKERTKIKEKIDKCVKEKLMDFCDVLNIQINKSGKKEELSAKLLAFLDSPHATTDVFLADKEKKGKKRATNKTKRKSSGRSSESPPKKQKKTHVGKKRKQSSDIEEDDTAELLDATIESQEDGEDVSVPKGESDRDDKESQSEEEEDKSKANKGTSKKTKEDRPMSVKKTSAVKVSKSNEKTMKKSTSKRTVTDNFVASISKSKQNSSKKLKTVNEDRDNKEKASNKKQTESKGSIKDQGKGSSNKKAKTEPTSEELHAGAVDILKKVDFNTVTVSDILKQLGKHFGLDLLHRKA